METSVRLMLVAICAGLGVFALTQRWKRVRNPGWEWHERAKAPTPLLADGLLIPGEGLSIGRGQSLDVEVIDADTGRRLEDVQCRLTEPVDWDRGRPRWPDYVAISIAVDAPAGYCD